MADIGVLAPTVDTYGHVEVLEETLATYYCD
jgi:hypothetical protein